MSIDRIGKPAGAPLGTPAPGIGGDSRVTGQSFQVSETQTTSKAAAAPLDQLKRGEISLDQYLDVRVNDATSHLEGKLNPDQLEFVKQSLREQLQTDPVLVELVGRAAGGSVGSL